MRRLGIAAAVVVVVLAVGGVLVIKSKQVDARSQRVVPAAVDRIAAAVPAGSTIVDRAVAVGTDDLQYKGRLIFVSSQPGPETRDHIVRSLGLSYCDKQDAGFAQSRPCGAAASPDDFVVHIQSAVVGASSTDDAKVLLGDRVGDFGPGSVVVQVVVAAA